MALGALTALQAAFAGLGGGIEGAQMYRQREEERKRQRAMDERQALMDEVMLRDKRFRPAEELAAARQPSGEALSRALSSATAMMRPGGMASGAAPSLQAGDTALVQQARSLAAPRERVSLGGRAFEREEAESYRTRLAGEEAAQGRMAKEAEQAQQRQAQEAEVEAMVAAGVPRAQATIAVRRGAKYGDLFMTPAEQERARTDRERLGVERERLRMAERAAGGGAGSKEQSAMQQMMVARVNTARLQAVAANAEMEKFEEDLISGKRKIGAIEAQLANEMFKDTRFNRIAEAQLNRMNPALAMYVRNAKAIGAAERLVMPRGGSNLLMSIETALAGVGPGATPELIRNTQAFRRGLVEGVQKETPEALMEAENARLESAIGTDAERRGAPTIDGLTYRPGMDFETYKRLKAGGK